MKRTIIAASIAALPIVLGVSAGHAEQPEAGSAIDASKMPESGPLVVGRTSKSKKSPKKQMGDAPLISSGVDQVTP